MKIEKYDNINEMVYTRVFLQSDIQQSIQEKITMLKILQQTLNNLQRFNIKLNDGQLEKINKIVYNN